MERGATCSSSQPRTETAGESDQIFFFSIFFLLDSRMVLAVEGKVNIFTAAVKSFFFFLTFISLKCREESPHLSCIREVS